MNQTSHLWPERNHLDPMVSASENDDFSNFLEFDLDFSAFDGGQQVLAEDGGNEMDTSMDHPDVANGQHGQVFPGGVQHSQAQMGGYHVQGAPQMSSSMQEQLIRQQQQLRQHHQNMQSQNYQRVPIIPPTPNSMELHGEAARYYQHLDANGQVVYERQQRPKEDMMAFTPLVSPAVTPLEAQFSVPEYTVPGAFFSPLTSPALEAQNSRQHRPPYTSAPSSDTHATTSPVDLNIDSLATTNGSAVINARKSRRRPTSSVKNQVRSVRQSPAMRPQTRKKQPSNSNLAAEDLSRILDNPRNAHSGPPSAKSRQPRSGTDSSTDSISPEPLGSEALMPPPAVPRSASASNSPYLLAQLSKSNNNEAQTPATLMRLQRQQGQSTPAKPSSLVTTPIISSQNDEMMEDIMLPEAATGTRPSLPPLDTGRANGDQSTPTMSARKTPTFGNFGTPITTASSSVAPSPQIRAITSPNGGKRTESKSAAGRGSKKRHTPSSSQVSPALRPKISPSIKPLIHEGTPGSVSAETSALYLASKSNYQNILEGTHLPGVSYPDALAENLTSKRTSHKIAEQGRRNRINTALKEIEALLPQTAVKTPDGGRANEKDSTGRGRERSNSASNGLDLDKNGSTAQGNSKASTVEMAIVYIKSLQAELAETKARLESAERKLEDGESVKDERESS